ncbi:hypothetical protein PMAYCL1PPCAC_10668, partial [Pristionchus mayeri]
DVRNGTLWRVVSRLENSLTIDQQRTRRINTETQVLIESNCARKQYVRAKPSDQRRASAIENSSASNSEKSGLPIFNITIPAIL